MQFIGFSAGLRIGQCRHSARAVRRWPARQCSRGGRLRGMPSRADRLCAPTGRSPTEDVPDGGDVSSLSAGRVVAEHPKIENFEHQALQIFLSKKPQKDLAIRRGFRYIVSRLSSGPVSSVFQDENVSVEARFRAAPRLQRRSAQAAARILPGGAARRHLACGRAPHDEPACGVAPGTQVGRRARGGAVRAARTAHLAHARGRAVLRARDAAGGGGGPPSRHLRGAPLRRGRGRAHDRGRADLGRIPAARVRRAVSRALARRRGRDSDRERGAAPALASRLRGRSGRRQHGRCAPRCRLPPGACLAVRAHHARGPPARGARLGRYGGGGGLSVHRTQPPRATSGGSPRSCSGCTASHPRWWSRSTAGG